MARLKASEASETHERRTAFVGANLTASERAEVVRRAAVSGLRLSDYVRASLLAQRPSAVTPPWLPGEVGRLIAVELVRVGNNLNQLAKHANATGDMPARDVLAETVAAIIKATEALTRL
jgi:hypothetical protein